MRRNNIGSSRRILHTGAAALIISLVGFASPASAHVTVTASTTAARAHAILQFSVGHGCGDSSTTKITIQIPAQITSVTPTRTALWKITKQPQTVTFSTETPLPDGHREVFELAVRLPDAKGTRLIFPTVQTCEQGEAAWIEVPQDGQNIEELELPAPSFIITEPAATAVSGVDNTLTFAALAAGLLGSVLGGVALVRQRRKP